MVKDGNNGSLPINLNVKSEEVKIVNKKPITKQTKQTDNVSNSMKLTELNHSQNNHPHNLNNSINNNLYNLHNTTILPPSPPSSSVSPSALSSSSSSSVNATSPNCFKNYKKLTYDSIANHNLVSNLTSNLASSNPLNFKSNQLIQNYNLKALKQENPKETKLINLNWNPASLKCL